MPAVGKTTLARHIAEGAQGEVLFAAFTGKGGVWCSARKGCSRRFYHPRDDLSG